MITTDRPEFVRAVNNILSVKGKPPMTTEQAQVWWDALKQLPLAECLHALQSQVQRSRFVPQPSDVYRAVTGREDAVAVPADLTCSYTDHGNRCTERWCISADNRNWCRQHYDQVHRCRGASPDRAGHRWQDLLGAYRALEMLGDQRARRAYGSDCVDYVLEHSAEIHAMLPNQARAGNVAVRKAVEKVYGPAP